MVIVLGPVGFFPGRMGIAPVVPVLRFFVRSINIFGLFGLVISLFFFCWVGTAAATQLFGYREMPQADMAMYVPQWLKVMERDIVEDVPEGNCTDSFFNRCHLKNWNAFLAKISNLSPLQQIKAVNQYANDKDYVLDMDNYGIEDYWAIVKEFFYNGGDCEDYAITKFFSLRRLGFRDSDLRIVILQDTNLRIPHAVLAVSLGGQILILDNQSREVLSPQQIFHYVPLFSVNEEGWVMYLPPS